MATRPHATSEEQVAALGKIRRKPIQYDLLTGNLAPKKVRIARGEGHIRLKSEPGEKTAIAGMAYFAGTGPQDKRCYQCAHLGDISVWRSRGRDHSTPEAAGYEAGKEPRRVERNACRKACAMYDGIVQTGGIEYELACKYFEGRQP